jgi:hypothetical protein
MADNKKLNNFIADLDLEFRRSVNGKDYEVSYPYHGGQVDGDVYSVVFGFNITDDDDNPDYINVIRKVKEEDFIKGYNIFLSEYTNWLKTDFSDFEEEELKTLKELIDFLEKTEPCFYSVEASS